MSKIKTILDRMMNDPAFAESIFADAETALAEYDLSSDEISKFKNLSRADFESYASTSPEERKSFGTTGSLGESFVYVRDEGG